MQKKHEKKRAVILVNLGSPAAPESPAIKKFLSQFLSDRRVVELPALLWRPLLRAVILPLRVKRLVHSYRKIWTEDGSPLTAMTLRQTRLLQATLRADFPQLHVQHAMTYGTPAIADVIKNMRAQGIEDIALIPLYPQYSGTSTGAVYDQLAALIQRSRFVPDVRVLRQYYEREDYIAALAQSVSEHWALHGRGEKLLFSFHGIPQFCVDKGDPYFAQCQQTAQAVATSLSLSSAQWGVCFQSRFGRATWLQPYTDSVLQQLPSAGVRSVDLLCPSFAADCLETLEEIEIGSRAIFLAAGGERFSRIACLNDHPRHIEMLANIVQEFFCASPR